MSDPAKSADEIEDVLASIRRLVSESGATMPAVRPAPAVAPVPDAGSAPVAEKLVLTPADRVTDPDDPWAPVPLKTAGVAAAADDADGDDTDEDEGDGPFWGPDDRLADWGEVEESGEEAVADARAEGQDSARRPPAPAAVDMDHHPVPDLGEEAEGPQPAEFEPETGDADWPDPGADIALRDLVAARGHGVTPEAAKADPANEAALLDQRSEAAGPTQEIPDATAPPEEGDSPMTSNGPVDGLEDDVAQESPRRAPVFSRRFEGPRDADGPRAAAPEDSDAASSGESDVEIEDLGEDPSPFTFPDSEEGILDEETLRDLIAEVVREELQGAMGQRITRNVRKMVRREIRIALAAEDLE